MTIHWNYVDDYCIKCKTITKCVYNQFNNKLLCRVCSSVFYKVESEPKVFMCPFCNMPNTYLKSSIVLIWEKEKQELIEEFLEKLKAVLLIENCDKAVEGTLLHEICKIKWEYEGRLK